MHFDASRVRSGEAVAAVGALLLLILMFALKWYGPGAITSNQVVLNTVNGWHGLIHLRWLMLLTILAALVLPLVAATTRLRAVHIAVSAIVALLGLVTLLWLGYRVFISVPPGQKPAAYIGLVCVAAVFLGACLSLFQSFASPSGATAPAHAADSG